MKRCDPGIALPSGKAGSFQDSISGRLLAAFGTPSAGCRAALERVANDNDVIQVH